MPCTDSHVAPSTLVRFNRTIGRDFNRNRNRAIVVARLRLRLASNRGVAIYELNHGKPIHRDSEAHLGHDSIVRLGLTIGPRLDVN